MYPTVSDFLYRTLGIDLPLPIQTFGFFVALGFLIGAYFFGRELKRKEEEEKLLHPVVKKVKTGESATTLELIGQGVLGFILGYKILFALANYRQFAANPQQYILSGEGSIVGGIVVAALLVWLKYREKEKQKLPQPKLEELIIRPHEMVGNMTMIAAFSGLLGAKIFHNLENLHEFKVDPIGALFSFSGLTMYGGLICGAFAVLYYAKKNGMKILPVMDASAPALMAAYGIGRFGCHFSGDGDWGIDNLSPKPSFLSFLPDSFWSFRYPHNVINEGIPIPGCEGPHCTMLPNPVFPTPLYEAIASLALFGILWAVRKRLTIPGQMFSLYLVFNGVERFLIEQIRVNSVYNIFGNLITQAQIISTLFIILGLAGLIYFTRKKKNYEYAGS